MLVGVKVGNPAGTVTTRTVGIGLLVTVAVAIKAKAVPLSTIERERLPKMIAEEIRAAKTPNQV